jgi:TRAP-type C4-dicarboxylate transport system permease large subunit
VSRCSRHANLNRTIQSIGARRANVLFTACAVGNTPLERVIKPILPMIAILTVTF